MAEMGVGRVVDNKYEIIASIGKGGMSNVWLGRDRRLSKLWAVKEIKPNVLGRQGEANRQAIIDEANFMKRLDHPAIPRVVDIIDTGQSVFVVMDYINGRALNRVMREQGAPFDQEEVIDWGIQLCDVLGYLHNIQPPEGYPVVYRDMKPSNVMLRDDGSVKVIDFGISMELLPSGPSDTRVIGTGGYGAPEQVDKEIHKTTPVDTRADIYALGTTLYSLVTSHVPRGRKNERGETFVDFDMRPIRDWNPQLSDGLEQIILRATQRDPADRYQTVDEMRYDLEHYEELTQEYRAVQQAKVDGFWWRVRAAGISAAVGVACLIGSTLLRNSSYDTLMHEASVASMEEQNVEIPSTGNDYKRTADASDAEQNITRAIELAPERIETYEQLLGVYRADQIFTPTESRRWNELWQRYGRGLEGDNRYASLCYDVGILYLSYYDFTGTKDDVNRQASGAADEITAAEGQSAIKNAQNAAEWFTRAKDACDRYPAQLEVLSGDGARDVYASLSVYETMGQFYNGFITDSYEGRFNPEDVEVYWQGVEGAILGEDALVKDLEEIVQLRLYQVAFESISSSRYLTSLQRAGISEERVTTMLEAIKANVIDSKDFRDFVNSTAATQVIFDEMEEGYDEAVANVKRTYNSPAARVRETQTEGEA